MLWLPPAAFGPTESNLTAADRNGTTITASATPHSKGAYSAGQLIASTAQDAYGITVIVEGIQASATVTSYLLDIGLGPSGSEVDLIQDLDCWGAKTLATTNSGAKCWYFPLFIPKGSRLAARAQALAASDTANVAIFLHQAPEGWSGEVPVMWERLGAVTSSCGVSVTPGNGAFGSWTTILDPITKHYRWFHVGMDGFTTDTTLTAEDWLIEVGIGASTAAVTTIGTWRLTSDTGEGIYGPYPAVPVFQPHIDDDANGVFARTAAGGTEARGVLVYAAQ